MEKVLKWGERWDPKNRRGKIIKEWHYENNDIVGRRDFYTRRIISKEKGPDEFFETFLKENKDVRQGISNLIFENYKQVSFTGI